MFTRIVYTVVLLLSLNLLATPANAQFFTGTYSAGVSVGYSTFSMRQMKEFQRDLERQYPVDMQILEQFPAYVDYNGAFLIHAGDLRYGLVVGHTSTGARAYYSDYTGHLSSDQIVTMTYVGATVEKSIASAGFADIFLGGQLLGYFNKLKFVEAQKIYDENSMVIERFNSRCVALQGFLQVQKNINRFQLKLHAGYELHMPAQLLYQNRKDYYLVNSSNEKVRLDASGLRARVGVFYTITGL